MGRQASMTGKTISAESLSCASPEDDDLAESVEDETGVDARRKRKERREQREVARLRRLAEKAAARRTGPSPEELRAQKIAEKVAARRAAKAAAELKGKETQDASSAEAGKTASQTDSSDPAAEKQVEGGQDVKEHSGTDGQPNKTEASEPKQTPQVTKPSSENGTSNATSKHDAKTKEDTRKAGRANGDEKRDKNRKEHDGDSKHRKDHRHDRRQSSRERRADQTSRSDRDDDKDKGRNKPKLSIAERLRSRSRSRSGRPIRSGEDSKTVEPKENSQGEQEKDEKQEASCENEEDGGSSSSSSSSSDSSAEEEQEAPKVCFAWEKGSLIAPSDPMYNMQGSGSMSPLAAEVEQFLCIAAVEGEAAQRLRVLPAHIQRMVMERGPIAGTANPTGSLIARIRDAELGRTAPGLQGAMPQNIPASTNPEIEKMITKWNLDYKASSMLRLIPSHKHELALAIPIDKARNHSAFVIAQLNSLFGGIQGIQDLNRIEQLRAGGSDATVRNMAMQNKKKKDPLFMETAVML
eukprot:TRINITY_DN103034_c0_g1_i1.p1 TRINITY_DN103034_c0_g1~~TRINITY_DN103034_c0_g1_i1.p1  ORF type:complete len:525 (-),score=90.30 TRINITY_DN103034_c0_g1_i1:104-1678(-)